MAILKIRPRKTIEDYLSLPEGTRAELIEGEILMSPSPKELHQRIVGNLFAWLKAFIQEHSLGRIYVAPFDVHLPSGDVVQPDLIFVSTARSEIIQEWVRGVPDLPIEVLSPENSERDLLVKRALYARNGVPEYWLVDPRSRSVEVLVVENGRYVTHGYFEESDVASSIVLTGLSLPVREIFL
jgi:Uma2 family endonuclease